VPGMKWSIWNRRPKRKHLYCSDLSLAEWRPRLSEGTSNSGQSAVTWRGGAMMLPNSPIRTFGSSFLDTKRRVPKLLHLSRSRVPRTVQMIAGITLRIVWAFRNLRSSQPASRPRSRSMNKASGIGTFPAIACSRYMRASITRSLISNSSNPARRAEAATVRSSAIASSRTRSRGIRVGVRLVYRGPTLIDLLLSRHRRSPRYLSFVWTPQGHIEPPFTTSRNPLPSRSESAVACAWL